MRVLIVKLGAIGDVIMASPMINEVRRHYPQAEITWLVGNASAEIARCFHGLDRVIEVDESLLYKGQLHGRVVAMLRVWRQIAFRRFDLIVIGHNDRRYAALTCMTRRGELRAFYERDRRRLIPGRWFPDEYVRLISNAEGPQSAVIKFPEISRDTPNPNLKWKLNNPYVVIAPGGARNSMRASPVRRWPVESYSALALRLRSAGFQVVVVGADSDRDLCGELSEQDVIDLIGKTNLSELAELIRSASVVVTHDSLALHMGVLVGTPVVALFGPTIPDVFSPIKYSSFLVKAIWGGESLPCRPCYDGREFAACSNNVCMGEITVTQVMNKLREIARTSKSLGVN